MENNIVWSTEEKEIDGDEVTVYFLDFPDGKRVDLSSKIDDEITEIHEIYNNDLVFVSVDEYTGKDLVGIYSIKQNKVVFPFIILEFDTSHKSGFIYILCDDGLLASENILELNVNPDNDFVYLYPDGSAFQNEGIIKEVVNKMYCILEDDEDKFKLYNSSADTDNCIEYSNIVDYEITENALILVIQDENKNNNEIRISIK